MQMTAGPLPFRGYRPEDDDAQIVSRRAAPSPSKTIWPIVYGREKAPDADGQLDPIHAPLELEARLFKDVTALPRNIVLRQNPTRVLSPTFIRRGMIFHGGIRKIDAHRFELKDPNVAGKPEALVDVPAYLADTDFPTVYGHWLVEVLPALWALHEFDQPHVMTSVRRNPTLLTMLSALDVPPERVVHIEQPTVVRQLICPSAPFYRRQWLHPAALEVFERLKDLSKRSEIERQDRIYISRSKVEGRKLLNEPAVEDLFRSNGFAIVHPQELKIEDQIALFSAAKCVAGSGGSAMHNVLFSSPQTRVLHVCSEGWMRNADTLISQVEGRLGYVFGEMQDATEEGRRTGSDWSVNLTAVADAIHQHFN